jgi:hypothetical protein
MPALHSVRRERGSAEEGGVEEEQGFGTGAASRTPGSRGSPPLGNQRFGVKNLRRRHGPCGRGRARRGGRGPDGAVASHGNDHAAVSSRGSTVLGRAAARGTCGSVHAETDVERGGGSDRGRTDQKREQDHVRAFHASDHIHSIGHSSPIYKRLRWVASAEEETEWRLRNMAAMRMSGSRDGPGTGLL